MSISGLNPAIYSAYTRPASATQVQAVQGNNSAAAGSASVQGTDGLLKKLQEQRRSLMNAGATLV